MKITGVTPYLVAARPSADGWSQGQQVLLVKLETACGLTGWGEAYALHHRQRGIREMILSLGEALKEQPEASPRRFLHHIAGPMMSKHPGIDFDSAVSALEIALWDLAGKAAGLPVHALLGGAIRQSVPIYANAWDNPTQAPEAIAARCAQMRAEGYGAVKIYPMRQPDLARAEEVVRLTREAIGPEADLMLDFAIVPDPKIALEAARAFAPYRPFWIEEPVAGDDLEALATFRSRTDIRITTGERQSGLAHFRNLLARQAADVLNPDICGAGGILRMLDIAALAQAHSVMVSPHSWNSTTAAYAAMMQVSALLPNLLYAELYYDYLALGAEYARCDFVCADGKVSIPTAPGLGVAIDESALQMLCEP